MIHSIRAILPAHSLQVPLRCRFAPLLWGSLVALVSHSMAVAAQAAADEGAEEICGELLDPATYGPAWIESLQAALERDAAFGAEIRLRLAPPARAAGAWMVPSARATGLARSGRHVAINEWGDLRMGIGFPEPVELLGVWIAGQMDQGVWPPALRARGFRAGQLVATGDWFTEIDAQPAWLTLGFSGIDRVEFEALPAFDGAAWYSIDDLTYERADGERVVVDFEDCEYHQRLSGSDHAGLVWERGTGLERPAAELDLAVVAPRMTPEPAPTSGGAPSGPGAGFTGGLGTAPVLIHDFAGARRFQNGNAIYPPDTCGAIGPAHFASILNRTFVVHDRVNGAELAAMSLGAFLPNSTGDPRILYDQHSGRWVALATPFDGRIQLAVSMSDDPMGDWFKTEFTAAQGTDSACTVDYPTLGVDEHGIYIGAFMAPGCGLTLFALDKAPLIDPSPSLGTITAFRGLTFEGALQPAHTHGPAPGEYVVSVAGMNQIRIRRVNPPLTSPSLILVGLVTVSQHDSPPNAPALGSNTALAGVGDRLINAVYRDGSLWTTHTVRVDNRSAARWYELDVNAPAVVQEGTVADPVRYFFFPSIAVNGAGDAVLAFSGSSPTQYVGAYFTGRLASDPPGEMAPPELLRAGAGPYNVLDAQGRNRWGDYSLTTLDPNDERTLWTLQEYTHQTDVWGTWVGVLKFGGTVLCPDGSSYCSTSPNSVGPGATMGFGGSRSVSLGDLSLEAVDCPPNRPAIFFYGLDQVALPFGNGLRCVGGTVHRLPAVVTDIFGYASLSIDFSAPPVASGTGALTVGSVWNFQCLYQDPAGGGSGFNLTDALQLQMCP